jgi:microcystin-dependent protein
MTQPFLGQIQPFAFGLAPKNWAFCNGQLLSISQNTALFSLLGTAYGGNGQTNFALPNLQSRVPMHYGAAPDGNNYVPGEEAGEEQVSVLITEMPMHNHTFFGTANDANDTNPENGVALAQITQANGPGDPYYAPDSRPQPLNITSLSLTGGNEPHANLQPFLTINWCIAMTGIFPSRN